MGHRVLEWQGWTRVNDKIRSSHGGDECSYRKSVQQTLLSLLMTTFFTVAMVSVQGLSEDHELSGSTPTADRNSFFSKPLEVIYYRPGKDIAYSVTVS